MLNKLGPFLCLKKKRKKKGESVDVSMFCCLDSAICMPRKCGKIKGEGWSNLKRFSFQACIFCLICFIGKVEWRLERVEKGIQESVGVFTLIAFW